MKTTIFDLISQPRPQVFSLKKLEVRCYNDVGILAFWAYPFPKPFSGIPFSYYLSDLG